VRLALVLRSRRRLYEPADERGLLEQVGQSRS
jgi:hypothetical protein